MRSNRRVLLICLVGSLLVVRGINVISAAADESPPSTVAPLLALLKKGTLPPERLGGVVKLVCERGNEHDLQYVFGQVSGPKWPLELRRDALRWLREAASTRKVHPSGGTASLVDLIADPSTPELRLDAVKLAGVWKPPQSLDALQSLATLDEAPESLRNAALDAIVAYGADAARPTIDRLLQDNQPASVRIRGVAALTRLDLPAAAKAAAIVLPKASTPEVVSTLLDAFLSTRDGADRLAAELRSRPPGKEVSLLALRHMYAVGRSDPALDAVLSDLAGVKGEVPRLTDAEIAAKVEQVAAQGDAARGEEVFRRADLACQRCHAVSKAGGQIGPDLSAVGVSSPVDYLVKSVFDPDAQKKEEFVTRILLTTDGLQLTGIVTNRTDEKLTLKTADGKLVDVAAADIDYEGVGKSLMPEGLVKFMTEQELLDLLRFLSSLGKPGTPYAIRQTQRMQRWRFLRQPHERVLVSIPDEEVLGDLVLSASGWEQAYGRVNGEVPLSELVARTGHDVIYLQGEVSATVAGTAELKLDRVEGVACWWDDSAVELASPTSLPLTVGTHTVTLRIDTRIRSTKTLSLELARPPGSSAQFTVVDGQ